MKGKVIDKVRINGRTYDIRTAKYIYSTMRGYGMDADYLKVILYRKRNGEFFFYKDGGPLSECGIETAFGTFMSGSKVEPITPEVAEAWLKANATADLYERLFAELFE